MWTGDEEDYRRAHLEMIDYYLDLAQRSAAAPAPYRSRWHNDGAYWIWTYEKNKTPAQFARLMERVRDGTMSFPLNTVVATYGGTPMEAVLRDMYYAGDLERRFHIKVPLALAMENQTLPYGLGALWAGAGAKYSWKGICGCLTELDRTGRRPHELYWWTAQDGSRILMKWNSLTGNTGARSMGGYAEARTAATEIAHVDTDADFQRRYPYPVVGIFGKGWDDLKTLTDEFPKIARAQTRPGRQVIVSNIVDFFEDVEASYGATLPSYSASFGNEWDLYTASVAELSARVRRAVERLRPAEAMASLVSLHTPLFMAPRQAQARQTWVNLGLFWEHNWTADSLRVPREMRANWGRRIAGDIEAYVDTLHRDAAYALAGLVASTPGAQRFYAFNPLGWTRSDAADIAYDSSGPVHVVDLATGAEVPLQRERRPEAGYPQGRQYLRIWAAALPPVGYKVYEIRPGAGAALAPAATVSGNVVENAAYRITVEERGAISSWIDKARGMRDFAGALQNGRWKINDLGQDVGTLSVESSGPVSVTLKAEGSSPLAHTSRITLYREGARVDIRNDINQGFDGTHTWGFAFNLKAPTVRHEEVGAIATARLLADGGNYAPTMARLEWLTLNHFADMTGDGEVGVTLSNADLAFMKLGSSGIHQHVSTLDTTTPQIQVLAGGQIDAPQAGIANQGGDRHFLQRFALTTHGAYDAAAAMRFALEHQNPPVTEWLRGGGHALPAASYSLLANSNPEVLLWALKPAEDGPQAGLVARVWNVGARAQTYTLTLQGGIKAAHVATHIETDISAVPVHRGAVDVTARPTQIQTLRLLPAGR
jgi:alpha-mannosidase